MTDRERIEALENRVDFLEASLKQALREMNRLVDLLIDRAKPQQTDCP